MLAERTVGAGIRATAGGGGTRNATLRGAGVIEAPGGTLVLAVVVPQVNHRGRLAEHAAGVLHPGNREGGEGDRRGRGRGGGRGGSEPPSLGSPPCRASRTRYYSPLAASVHQPSTPPRHHSTTAHGTSTSPQHTVTAHGHTILYLAGAGAVPGVHLGHLGLQVAAVVAVPLGEAPCPAHAVRVGPGPPQHSHSTATAQPHHSHSTPSDRKHQSRNIPLGTKHRALSTTHGHCVACARGAMWPRTPCAKWSITMSHKDG